MMLATDQNPEEHGITPRARQFLALREPVMERWEREVRARVQGAATLLRPILTNTLPAFFDNIGEALSPGHPRRNATSSNNAAAVHGGERARMTSYGPDQVVHEYQILREAITAEASERLDLSAKEWAIIEHSIDAAVREAIREFASIQDDLRRKLAGALSHDMRTPLAVILSGAQLIGLSNDLPANKQFAEKVEANARRLEDMMSELLDALTSKASDQLPLQLSEFDIAELLTDVSKAYARPHEVEFSVMADSTRGWWCRNTLRRALENLINNALTHGAGRKIGLATSQVRGRMMLSVHNDGQAIPKERQNEIFEYGSRGACATAPGWGLGLPFVKRATESHGGSIAVDSSEQTGTTFLIDIPIDCRPFVKNPA
ncbi:sensor histidine kinase KdpD [Massilia sp. 9096]|uniref:sensor histidine kinase n=1 Tax=Massilia sp. 9096 TaxID=1500894 RepID=UPI0005621B17|nr:HAMP domain-containing sensor histidine kinase [Massilia sp. 9096]